MLKEIPKKNKIDAIVFSMFNTTSNFLVLVLNTAKENKDKQYHREKVKKPNQFNNSKL